MSCPRRRGFAPAARPSAEPLEERIALAIFTVTTTADLGAGSLRQAILSANAVNSDDTIVFDAAVFSTAQTIEVSTPLPQFGSTSGGLSIVGPGSALLTVRKNGAGAAVARRVFDSFSPRLALSGMTVTGGNVTANGGGLSVAGIRPDVTLDDVVFTGNTANFNDGGAVFLNNNATLTARNCTFFNNSARLGGGIMFFDGGLLVMDNCVVGGNVTVGASVNEVSGGGIYFAGAASNTPPEGYVAGMLVVRNSEINRNVGFRDGGGIGMDGFTGTLMVQNCTVTQNTANDSGGGLALEGGPGALWLQNSTVTNNSANGTGLFSGGGGILRTSLRNNVLTVDNSIVSGNTHPAAPDIRTDLFTTVNVNSSAIGSPTGFTLSGSSGNNLPFGTNLMLGPLQNNGGRTQTYALLPGSPAINAGSNARVPAGLPTDQRGPGFPRVVGPAVDIGSYERAEPPKVTAVFVRGQAWSLGFRQFIQNRGLGESAFGYAIPSGADQLKTLPWVNLDQISMRFSQDVSVVSGNLAVGGITLANYPVASFGYEPVSHTAVWTLSQPLRNDRVTLGLNAAAIVAAGAALDGEWADGTHAFPSGNGVAGGDFRFRMNVLPGDVDRSGAVLANDVSEVKKKFFTTPASPGTGDATYDIFHDVNGSASILADDFSEVKKRFFNTLPAATGA